ncbi:MAG TPA: hypothetical protein VGC13_15785 [Longimicrobium sp.]|jgi:hypothetical protein|uniref:hypothetical protein n=1 Tax=Longimicrobium sp. TaxID=2029185 RepID=UPI002EDAE9C8
MSRLKLQVESIQVVSFEPSGNAAGAPAESLQCTIDDDCMVTGGINSCWCSEINSCWCTEANSCDCP